MALRYYTRSWVLGGGARGGGRKKKQLEISFSLSFFFRTALASQAGCVGNLGWPGQSSQIWKLSYFVRFGLWDWSKIHRSNLAGQCFAEFTFKRLVLRQGQAHACTGEWWVTCHGSIRYPPSTLGRWSSRQWKVHVACFASQMTRTWTMTASAWTVLYS